MTSHTVYRKDERYPQNFERSEMKKRTRTPAGKSYDIACIKWQATQIKRRRKKQINI